MVEFWEHIKLDDLEGESREMADIIGLEAFLDLTEYYGGNTVYIPKSDSSLKKARHRCIAEEYRAGADIKVLARKYRMSTRNIYYIINGDYDKEEK